MLYNIDFEIAGLILLVAYYIYFITQYEMEGRDYKLFRYMILVVASTMILDMSTAYTISYADNFPLWLNEILNPLFFIASVSSSYMLSEYMRIVVAKDIDRKLMDKINRCVYILFVLLCVSNPFVHLFLYFDASKKYCHGPLYYAIYIIPFLFISNALVKVIHARNDIQHSKFLAALMSVVITLSGTILQLVLFGNILGSYYASTMAIMLLLQSFETPDYILLMNKTDELRQSQRELEMAKDSSDEKAKTIHRLMRTSYWALYFNEDGSIKRGEWSDEFFHMLGYESGELSKEEKTLLWSNSLHPDDKKEAEEAFYAGTKGAEYNHEFRLSDKFGQYRWYNGTGSLVMENGKPVSYQGIIRDIDDEKYRDELIRDRMQALYDLGKSQEKLKAALLAAEEASRAKTAFLSNMSHDIRTPMNAIVGFTELALEHVDDPKEVTDCLNTINASGNHLLSLINDILDMSRIESGKVKINLVETDLRVLLNDLKDILSANINEKNQRYIEDYSGVFSVNVMCDKLRLNQVLINCLGNSVKFTPNGGKITISVREEEKLPDGRVIYLFHMTDNGIGMKKEFIERIFEPFERERSSSIDKTQGSGLGMAITKNLVNMMQGTIEVASEVNVGTEYFVRLPLLPIDENSVRKNENTENAVPFDDMVKYLKGKTFLVVDDNAVNRKIVVKLLGNLGIHVDEAASGMEAIDILSNENPDKYELVFMDIMMPNMDGYETTEKIRAISEELAELPIIAMTANAFEEDKKAAADHGMVAHVAKPFKLEELIETMHSTLS